MIERQRAVEASGLPECDWVQAFDARPLPDGMKAQTKQLDELFAHSASCPTCIARANFAEEHCPPLPPQPMPFWLQAFGKVGALQERLPVWARPVVTVAIVFGLYSLVRTVFLLPRIAEQPRLVLTAIWGTTLSISIGAGIASSTGPSSTCGINAMRTTPPDTHARPPRPASLTRVA